MTLYNALRECESHGVTEHKMCYCTLTQSTRRPGNADGYDVRVDQDRTFKFVAVGPQ